MDVKGDQEGANEGRRQKRQSRGARLCLVDKDSQDLGGGMVRILLVLCERGLYNKRCPFYCLGAQLNRFMNHRSLF